MPPKKNHDIPEYTLAQLLHGYRSRRQEYENAFREEHPEYQKITQWLKEHDDG